MTHRDRGSLTSSVSTIFCVFVYLAFVTSFAAAGEAEPRPAPSTPDFIPSEGATGASAGEEISAATLADYDLGVAARCAATILGDTSFENWGKQVIAGDINGDGVSDFILSGPKVDHPSGFRADCGSIAIFYGSSSFVGDTFDLAVSNPNVRIYGAAANELAGEALAFADVNGDGKGDLIIGAPGGSGPAGTKPNCGRVYIIFNSPGLPSGIDLTSGASVTIYGAETGVGAVPDQAGSSIATGKIDTDTKYDLLINAPGGDGSANGKIDCGQYHILYGRSPWPTTIDLSTQSDVVIYGPDAGDGYYNIDGTDTRALNCCAIGKLDGDNLGDLALGFPGGDGRNNNAPTSGEVRVLFGSNLSATVNLATAPNKFLFGAESLDVLSTCYIANLDADNFDDLFMIAFNADGIFNQHESAGEMYIQFGRTTWLDTMNAHFDTASTVYYPPSSFDGIRYVTVGSFDNVGGPDMAISAYGGDGPSDTRSGCGDVYVFFNPGRVDGFKQIDFVSVIPDALIFGPGAGDRIGISGLASGDVNSDGYQDILIGASTATYSTGVRIQTGKAFLASGKMVAIGDRDNDGTFGCLDNCPLIANSSQSDIDADGYGDVCDNCPSNTNANQADGDNDGDGDVCDNCPSYSNPDQADNDSDGKGNLCDNCRDHANSTQTDGDGDGWGNVCDPCPVSALNNCCILAGDPDNSGSINIGDVTYLITYIFNSGPAPVVANSGNANCLSGTDISDATYLIDFIFMNGEPPCCKL